VILYVSSLTCLSNEQCHFLLLQMCCVLYLIGHAECTEQCQLCRKQHSSSSAAFTGLTNIKYSSERGAVMRCKESLYSCHAQAESITNQSSTLHLLQFIAIVWTTSLANVLFVARCGPHESAAKSTAVIAHTACNC